MVKIIVHRVNSLQESKNLEKFFGIETDLRDYKNNLILSHNPHSNGANFYKFISKIDKTIFLNIKSSGIVKKIIPYIKKKKIFLLDISFSEFDYLYHKKLSNKIILRFSSYEEFNLKSKFFKKITWIWFDYFNSSKIKYKQYKYLKKNKKKICIVSPDLVGKKNEILNYIKYLNKKKIIIDGVCVKKENIQIWKKYYNY